MADGLEFQVLDCDPDGRMIAGQWEALLSLQCAMPYGLGPTSDPGIALLTRRVLLPRSVPRILIAKRGEQVHAILPCYSHELRIGPFNYTAMGLIADLYPGRAGAIYRPGQLDDLRGLFMFALSESLPWDNFEVTHISGSEEEAVFLEAASRYGLAVRLSNATAYPYISFPDSWEELANSFTSKFRYNLRSRERKLLSEGMLEITSYERPEQVDRFLHDMELIEGRSWKQDAGTSLTTNPLQLEFHKALLPECAAKGVLMGYVMYLDDVPIAHIIGLYWNRTFYCLKSSFVDLYRKFSPGIILKAEVMKRLIQNGALHWDFVGPAEDHKLQWTKATYTLNRYSVFRGTILGRLLRMRRNAGTALRAATKTQPE